MRKIIFFLLFIGSLFGAKAQDTDIIKGVNAVQFKEAIFNKDVQLIDVRTPGEYEEGHIANAVNIDFYQEESFVDTFSKMDKSKPVYLYCRSGKRSRNAAQKLADMGFSKIYDLEGGYMAWSLQK
jgi:rhodanese-related sulfurtransferase